MRKLLLPLLVALATACPRPQPGDPPRPGVVACATDAVRQNWPRLVAPVNACLAAASDGTWTACLVGLIDPAVGITENVVRCVVNSAGQSYGDAASRNPGDSMSVRAAARAAEWNRGWSFSP